jgi:hypothetical protein
MQIPLEDGGNITGQKFIAGPVRSHRVVRREKEHETERSRTQTSGNIETAGDTQQNGHPTFYPVCLIPLFHGFPVVPVSALVCPLGIVGFPLGAVV